MGVDLRSLGASGSLDNFGRLTGLNYIYLINNSFSGDAAQLPLITLFQSSFIYAACSACLKSSQIFAF